PLRLCDELHCASRSSQEIKLTRAHFKATFESLYRVRPDEDLERARFDREAQFAIIETEFRRAERERDAASLARLQRDALEAFQLANWSRDARSHVVYVELYHLVARAPACVCDFDADVQVSAHGDARRTQLQVRELKLRVAETIAEGIERRERHIQVF